MITFSQIFWIAYFLFKLACSNFDNFLASNNNFFNVKKSLWCLIITRSKMSMLQTFLKISVLIKIIWEKTSNILHSRFVLISCKFDVDSRKKLKCFLKNILIMLSNLIISLLHNAFHSFFNLKILIYFFFFTIVKLWALDVFHIFLQNKLILVDDL